ncbi:MAG: metallophosphoesterase [Pseudomonadota bacterium]
MSRVLHLPDHGRLLVATDLQGNLHDYERIEDIFRAAIIEEEGDAHVLFTGDLIHGPHLSPEEWPDFLGEYYFDESPALVDRFVALQYRFPNRVHAILGNHEHAHIGGPHTAKFAPDEVVLLESTVGARGAEKLRTLFRTFPLVAVAPCGMVFSHGAPAADIRSPEAIEEAVLEGFDRGSPVDIFSQPVIGPLLWARSAPAAVARRFLRAMGGKISVFGHDVIPEGFERIGEEQMIVSTSFGLANTYKVYLDVDLASQFSSVYDLREEAEILPLYPDAAAKKNPGLR